VVRNDDRSRQVQREGEDLDARGELERERDARGRVRDHEPRALPGHDHHGLAKIEGLTSEVEIDVGHEEYQGETQVRVKWVNRLKGGGTAKALDAGKTKSFAERMKARVAMADAARSAKEAMNGNATPALGATGSDEKLPF
jgi:hypothetical protein